MRVEISTKMTLEEVVEKYTIDLNVFNCKVIYKEDAINLMRFVRDKTIKEFFNKVEIGFNIRNANKDTEIETFILEESILKLDKDSIEI